jgi:amidophosphoribosyltransferase
MGEFYDECAVAGVFGSPDAARLCSDMQHMTQHRGPAAAGMATFDGTQIHLQKARGLVREVFTKAALMRLPGNVAMGHNRYVTQGNNGDDDAQPFTFTTPGGHTLAGGSNGDVPRYKLLRTWLAGQANGEYAVQTKTDGEALVRLIGYYLDQGQVPREAILSLMQHPDLEGAAYSAVCIIDGELWAFRDPMGFRPLVLGRFGTAYVVASETCAFKIIGATYVREVFRGEIVCINKKGERSYPGLKSEHKALCVFEFIYFGRPDSKIFGHSVSAMRKKFGARIWRDHGSAIIHDREEYVVCGVPDSSKSTAIGFSRASGLPYDLGIIRSHYAGRGFLHETQDAREEAAKIKYSPDDDVVLGKRVIVIDDSLVRGTTLRKLVRMLRLAGAIEVIVLIGSPPITHPCFFGIDTPTFVELVASHMSEEEICHNIEADYLGYLSIQSLRECLPNQGKDFCFACFTGKYPCQENIPPEKFSV